MLRQCFPDRASSNNFLFGLNLKAQFFQTDFGVIQVDCAVRDGGGKGR
jgi:hypothetical protein